MADLIKPEGLHISSDKLTHYGRIIEYPCGIFDLQCSTKPIFREPGYEDSRAVKRVKALSLDPSEEGEDEPGEDQSERSKRRARSRVRRLSLSNEFSYFVTLTLDGSRIDRYDEKAIVRKMGQWLSNQVKRKGLQYVLVPERHKDGAIHFHGFLNNALDVVDSGTLQSISGGKPRKPRSEAQRAKLLGEGARVVYNLPGWTFGFSTAMELYGDYPAAVAYVCKYIGKQGEKIGGRWYYSGGDLQEPRITYADLDVENLVENYGKKAFRLELPGQTFVCVNGLRKENSSE